MSDGNALDTSAVESISRCLVYCRLRPSSDRDFQEGGYPLLSLEDKRVTVDKDERCYDFDGTFGAESEQKDIFRVVALPALEHAFKGYCSAVMAYGQTGTGKSYTMCCTTAGSEGIIPRAADYIFNRVSEYSRATTRSASTQCTVVGQFVQIYRDQLSDLMTERGRNRVDVTFDKANGVTLQGCSSRTLSDEGQFMNFYEEGNSRRVVRATQMNPESSRGHSAMVITISCSSVGTEGPMTTTRGKITFIDLAGYERFDKTGITTTDPVRKDEAKTINASLLALGHVVSSLSAGEKYIPWRNSKLTRILQDSIGGNSRTTIILTVGPSSEHLHETMNSLQLGQRAMAVKAQTKASTTVDYEQLAAQLRQQVNERDERIRALEQLLDFRDSELKEISERYSKEMTDVRSRYESELQQLREAGASDDQIKEVEVAYGAELETLKEQNDDDVDAAEEKLTDKAQMKRENDYLKEMLERRENEMQSLTRSLMDIQAAKGHQEQEATERGRFSWW